MENVYPGHESRFGYAKWSFWNNELSKIVNERLECCNHFNKLLKTPSAVKVISRHETAAYSHMGMAQLSLVVLEMLQAQWQAA